MLPVCPIATSSPPVILRINGCVNAGVTVNNVPSNRPPSTIVCQPVPMLALTNITAVKQETYNIACPVKKIYLKRVKRANKILTIIPANIISAVVEPYLTRAIATTASLLGTTPCTCNANLNMEAKGDNAF